MMIIETQELSKRYGNTVALKGLSLSIEAGGVVGLLGPNGAGKTTLVETFEGLRAPSAGRVSVLGLDPTKETRALKERIGVQLQSTAVPLELTPLETLRLFGAFFRKSLKPAEVLERVGLTGKMKSRNSTLSGGQRQRLAIAMALINDPELIILDEPTGGLDPLARQEIHSYIKDLRTAKRTVLLSTHYIEEAEKLCDRVILLRAGEIVADGSPSELVSRATGAAMLSITLAGEFDPSPLLRAGATREGSGGENQRFNAADPLAAIPALAELLRNSQARIADLQMKRPSLEDVYLSLMGEEREATGTKTTGDAATGASREKA
jgi:ABC-2 type transport system ATP-binding protein